MTNRPICASWGTCRGPSPRLEKNGSLWLFFLMYLSFIELAIYMSQALFFGFLRHWARYSSEGYECCFGPYFYLIRSCLARLRRKCCCSLDCLCWEALMRTLLRQTIASSRLCRIPWALHPLWHLSFPRPLLRVFFSTVWQQRLRSLRTVMGRPSLELGRWAEVRLEAMASRRLGSDTGYFFGWVGWYAFIESCLPVR